MKTQTFITGQRVLISGGSGLVGRYLTTLLLSEGYSVSHLSRKQDQFGRVRVFRWDPGKGIINPLALEGVDYIIHLSGANIGEKRWSNERKKEIINSRVESAQLLYKVICDNTTHLKGYITASAIGYYGSVTSDRIFHETDTPAEDFLGTTCRLWENSADLFGNKGARIVKIRTGVVMERSDSALSRMLASARFGIFPRLGTSRQFMPWIHITDLCNIYLKAIQDEKMEGAYNAVAPQHVTQSDFMKTLAKVLDRPFFHPPVPAFAIKAIMGEMADIALKGSRVSSEKIRNAGYEFHYPDLGKALKNVLEI